MANKGFTQYQVIFDGKSYDANSLAVAKAKAELLTAEGGEASIIRCVVAFTVKNGVVQDAVDAD